MCEAEKVITEHNDKIVIEYLNNERAKIMEALEKEKSDRVAKGKPEEFKKNLISLSQGLKEMESLECVSFLRLVEEVLWMSRGNMDYCKDFKEMIGQLDVYRYNELEGLWLCFCNSTPIWVKSHPF